MGTGWAHFYAPNFDLKYGVPAPENLNKHKVSKKTKWRRRRSADAVALRSRAAPLTQNPHTAEKLLLVFHHAAGCTGATAAPCRRQHSVNISVHTGGEVQLQRTRACAVRLCSGGPQQARRSSWSLQRAVETWRRSLKGGALEIMATSGRVRGQRSGSEVTAYVSLTSNGSFASPGPRETVMSCQIPGGSRASHCRLDVTRSFLRLGDEEEIWDTGILNHPELN